MIHSYDFYKSVCAMFINAACVKGYKAGYQRVSLFLLLLYEGTRVESSFCSLV